MLRVGGLSKPKKEEKKFPEECCRCVKSINVRREQESNIQLATCDFQKSFQFYNKVKNMLAITAEIAERKDLPHVRESKTVFHSVFWIPQAKISCIPESGFPYMRRKDFSSSIIF